jgi:hypothetical protein
MPKPKNTAPSEPPPWVGLPGGSLEWLAQGITENLRRRAAQAAQRRRERGEAEVPAAGHRDPDPASQSKRNFAEDFLPSGLGDGSEDRCFYNKISEYPVAAMRRYSDGCIDIEIVGGHLDADGERELVTTLERMLRYTR